jgi:hypothetical protein
VESVSSGITHGKDKGLAISIPHVGKLVDVVQDLVEEGNHVNRVRGRARSVIGGTAAGVGHVRLVIGRVEVHTIPAGWEEDLGTETVGAVGGGHSPGLGRGGWIIQADEAHSLGSEIIGLVTLERVTSKHAEALGEGLELVVVRAGALQVVDVHASVNTVSIAELRNVLERAVLELIVQLGGPVVGQVGLDWAGRALGRASLGIVHIEAESITTGDGMNVARDGTRADNGVCTLGRDTTWAGHTEEGSSRCCKRGNQAQCGSASKHLEVVSWYLREAGK